MQYMCAEILSKKLKALRKKSGKNQREFAKQLGIEPSQLNRLEQGVLNTTLDTLDRICEGLELKPYQLFRD